MAGMYGCFKSRNSDSAAMASGPPDVMANQEPAEVAEECSGKKKSKFQTFKKFFARKKRKEPPAAGADAGLKGSQSTDNVSKTSENNTLTRSEKDKGSGSKISLGSKALSHDSVFVSDSSEANEALGASQDSIHGKVKSLQLQLKQAIKLGSPPSLMCVKRTEDAGTMSEDDGLPCSPPEYTAHSTAMHQAQRNSSVSLEGVDSEDDQLSCAASSRAVSPLVVPGDFSQPASPFGCLDNSAAKHKLGLRNKACNRRKPISRLELKTEEDSAVEKEVNTSITEASEEQDQQKAAEVASGDGELTPKEARAEEEEAEEDEEEKEQPQHSNKSLLRDKDEREEGEDESEAEQDVPHSPDTSAPAELCVSEEAAPDAQPTSSSNLSSRTSSLESPRATPEPPADLKEYLLDSPGTTDGTEENLALKGEDRVQENREEEEEEEESSFLQEVLSSLKSPLVSSSLAVETEGVAQEIEKVDEGEREDVEVEGGEEVKNEELEVDEPVSYQVALESDLTDLTQEEEVGALSIRTPSSRDAEEEEKNEDEEDAAEEEKEEDGKLVMEPFNRHGQKEGEKEEAEEVKPDDQNDLLTGNTVIQAEQEGTGEDESEGEEEAIELEKEPEVEEEAQEKREEDGDEVQVNDGKESVEEAEEATEEEGDDAEEMVEAYPDTADEGVEIAVALQEVDEGADVLVGCNSEFAPQHTNDDEIPTELGDHEDLVASRQSSEEGREDEEEREEECPEILHTEHKSDHEENDEAKQPDGDQTEQDSEQEGVEIPSLDIKQVEKDETEATEEVHMSPKPSDLSLPESHYEMEETGNISPSKTSTATLHINLCSPSSEKAFFQQSSPSAYPKESEATSQEATVHIIVSAAEEAADIVETGEQDTQPPLEEEASPLASVEEPVNQLSASSDQSKVCFTIAPAWQRSLSTEDAKESMTPPSSPSTCVSSASSTVMGPEDVEVEATCKDSEVKAEPVTLDKVETVLSPGRVRNVTTPSSPIKSQTSAASSTEAERSVVVEGNPDNPFGVRLRKTSVLHRFSSEEENTEPPIEPTAQPTSSKADPPQPVSVKPAISQPVGNKPALPKKPDVHGDAAGKNKRISDSDAAAARGVSGGSDSPSWISVAKQKQKIYKENSLEEITVKKEEQERKSSLPMYVSSAVNREHSNKTAESIGKVSPLETSKPSVSIEKEARRALSPPAPVPPQPPKSQSLHCPVPPKPHVPPVTAKPPPQRSLSPPTPVPVSQKSPSSTSPAPLSKPATSSKTPQPPSTTVTSPPFSSRSTLEKSGPRVPGISSQTPSSQRGVPPPALAQDEPPWMALAKKKAKAWSEMPQIVQ